MSTQRKPATDNVTIKKSDNFDLEKGTALALKIARRNKEWVREMAKK